MHKDPYQTYIAFGDAVKAMGDGKVGGYLVRFTTASEPDLEGDFFTAKTYFGPRDGDGADMLFHHSVPLKSGLEVIADHIFAPIKTIRDKIGIWADAVLDMSDQYEALVYELAAKGKLGWSSGAANHMVRRKGSKDAGEITRWPIAEGSLTPAPADPKNMILSLKSLDEFQTDDLARIDVTSIKAKLPDLKTIRDCEDFLRDEGSFSKSAASALLAHFKAIFQGDPGDVAELKGQIAILQGKVGDYKYRQLMAELAVP